MEKRYQVFVSSTFKDLTKERSLVFKALMDMRHIPAGMEFFPAIDEEQMRHIKRIIDDSDYYLLIIAGRYGSISPEGLSYTEHEYDYAVDKGIKIIALLHESPENLPAGNSENSPQMRKRLAKFRSKVSTGRLVKFWNKSEDLPGQVAISLGIAIADYPAVGWVRGSVTASQEILSEINDLRKENDDLRLQLMATLKDAPLVPGLASLDSSYSFKGVVSLAEETPNQEIKEALRASFVIEITWRELFDSISDVLYKIASHQEIKAEIINSEIIQNKVSNMFPGWRFLTVVTKDYGDEDSPDISPILMQFRAMKLIEHTRNFRGADSWKLTEKGEFLHLDSRVYKTRGASKTGLYLPADSGEASRL